MTHRNAAFRNQMHFKGGLPQVKRWLLHQVFKAIGPAPIRLAFCESDGAESEEVSPPGVRPVATIVIRDLATLAGMMIDPEVAFGEGYADGSIDVRGDLSLALAVVYQSWSCGRADRGWYQQLTSKWANLRQANTLTGSRSNIHNHYDLGNNFYKLWLDRQLVYTCAYFPSGSATLEEAQEAKLDYVCRKLRLRPGERVVEAGCGWGALALHMARNYGVSVKAYNISREQIAHARRRAVEEGLSDRVQFVEDDWRNISGAFDAFVSVGMLEHVSVGDYARLGAVVHRSIGNSGRGLLHFIGRAHKGEFSRWIRKRIFPGAYAPTLAEAANILEPYDYSVFDVENLRPHYARTLNAWRERFVEKRGLVRAMGFGEKFIRMWEFYLCYCEAGFAERHIGTVQMLLAKPGWRV